MIDTVSINERCLNDFKPNYLSVFATYHAKELNWSTEYTIHVTRDAVRFLALCAEPPAGQEDISEAHVMVSSPDVDKIVDAIFLDSLLLIWLENNIFGARMLHVPYYAHGETERAISNAHYDFTIALMLAAGYEIDKEIWPSRLSADYFTCHCGNDLEDCKVMPMRR